MYGWQCPKCGSTHAPHVQGCCGPVVLTGTTVMLNTDAEQKYQESLSGLAQQIRELYEWAGGSAHNSLTTEKMLELWPWLNEEGPK